MKLAVFDTHTYDREALAAANVRYAHDLTFFDPRLTRQTASMATGFPAVCSFVNDRVDAETIATLQAGLSEQVLQDDVLARLLTFPNVLITSHQAFLTREALANIADTTLANVSAFERGEHLSNEVRAEQVFKTVSGRTSGD